MNRNSITGNDSLLNRCPKQPIIPNARYLHPEKEGVSARYNCSSGYTAFSSVTRELIDQINLKCENGAWAQYPFPICRKFASMNVIINPPTASTTKGEEGEDKKSTAATVSIIHSRSYLDFIYLFLIGCIGSSLLMLCFYVMDRQTSRYVNRYTDPINTGDLFRFSRAFSFFDLIKNRDLA